MKILASAATFIALSVSAVAEHSAVIGVSERDAGLPQGNDIESFGGEWSLVASDLGSEAADVAAGGAMYADGCAQCHGRTGRGMASFPSLSGQAAEDLADLLQTYRSKERIGANSALMFPVAAELSDADIANLAAFISSSFE